jgi:hypothetical protein
MLRMPRFNPRGAPRRRLFWPRSRAADRPHAPGCAFCPVVRALPGVPRAAWENPLKAPQARPPARARPVAAAPTTPRQPLEYLFAYCGALAFEGGAWSTQQGARPRRAGRSRRGAPGPCSVDRLCRSAVLRCC